jgi:hypothetical protein
MGTGANDRNFDDKIVKGPGLHPRQPRHLRALLDLEGAERVGLPDHGKGPRRLRRYRREIQFDALGTFEKIERALRGS